MGGTLLFDLIDLLVRKSDQLSHHFRCHFRTHRWVVAYVFSVSIVSLIVLFWWTKQSLATKTQNRNTSTVKVKVKANAKANPTSPTATHQTHQGHPDPLRVKVNTVKHSEGLRAVSVLSAENESHADVDVDLDDRSGAEQANLNSNSIDHDRESCLSLLDKINQSGEVLFGAASGPSENESHANSRHIKSHTSKSEPEFKSQGQTGQAEDDNDIVEEYVMAMLQAAHQHQHQHQHGELTKQNRTGTHRTIV